MTLQTQGSKDHPFLLLPLQLRARDKSTLVLALRGVLTGNPPVPIPHAGILHPHWSFLLYFWNAREAVKPLMFPGVLLQCLYLHTPTSTQPAQGDPHLQAAWCVLPKGQHCVSTHPAGPSWLPRWPDTCHSLPAASIHFNPGQLSFFSLVSNPIPYSH